MMNNELQRSYEHTQRSPLYLLTGAVAGAFLTAALFLRDQPAAAVPCLVFAGLMVLITLMFHHLTVYDDGDGLMIRYGPLPVFRKRIRYDEISDVVLSRSAIIDGWGIHWLPGRGWTYNLWGFDCAKLCLDRTIFRIGSDDAVRLVEFLRCKLPTGDPVPSREDRVGPGVTASPVPPPKKD